MAGTPQKLKKDAIIEAICEVRFESSEIPEVAVGTISKLTGLEKFIKKRLPVADIPTPIRLSDKNLKYKAILELSNPEKQEVIRIGGNSVSVHLYSPYPGWEIFLQKIEEQFNPLFDKLADFRANRIGLRYLNALTNEDHFISSINDLEIQIRIADQEITPQFNLNFKRNYDSKCNSIIRVASIDFIVGKAPKNAVAFIDIDTLTPDDYEAKNFEEIREWLNTAHEFEKRNFFELLSNRVIDKIKER